MSRSNWTWDDASNPRVESVSPLNGSGLPTASFDRTFSDAGELRSVIDALGTTTYTPGRPGRLDTVTDTVAGTFDFDLDDSGESGR